MKRAVLIIVILALGAAGALYESGYLALPQVRAPRTAEQKRAEPAPPAASVVKTAVLPFRETVLVTGTLVPREEILVTPEVEGLRVLTVHFDEGDRVKKGDVLATLVQEQLDAQLAQNTANLARAEASMAQAKSSIAQAEARLAEAQSAFERAKPLKQSGYLAESVFDQREAAAKTADAQLVSARDGLRYAEAEKAQAEAQRREVLWRKANTEVKAPADGVISRRQARVGAMASAAAEPMFRIIARGEVELDAEAPEVQLARIKAGQPAEISVTGLPEVTGRVRLVSPEVDKATRLGRVRIALDGENLRIGSFGRGIIVTATGSGLAVPASALLYGADSSYVQVVREGRVSTRRVKTGLQASGMVEVREGLAEGDVVIAKSGTFLRDGDVVRPVFQDQSKLSEAR